MKFWLFCIVFVGLSLVAGMWLFSHPNTTAEGVLGILNGLLLVAAVQRFKRASW